MQNWGWRFYWKIYRRVMVLLDKINGVDFAMNYSNEELGFTKEIGERYSATPPYDLVKALNQLNIQSSDSILDFGSGKGLAIVTMAKYPFKIIGGVEITKRLSDVANKNLRKEGIQFAKVYFVLILLLLDSNRLIVLCILDP